MGRSCVAMRKSATSLECAEAAAEASRLVGFGLGIGLGLGLGFGLGLGLG